MKMTPEHYQAIKTQIKSKDVELNGWWEKYQAQGLSEKRYRWDRFHLIKPDYTVLYSYLNDEHIDTALRTIFGHKG